MPGRLVMERDAVETPDRLSQEHPKMAATNATPNGLSNGTTKEQQLPPELEHWGHTYVPMGTLLERMAQQCFYDLGEVIDRMADLTISAPSPQLNGASTSLPDSSQQSVEKKMQLMTWAQTQKDRFIKALVLSDWARNMGDMDKLIELRMWLQQQDDASSLVTDAIMRLKHNMIAAKMPNPNIQGALELLSTSKAPWMPHLGYVPAKPLSAQKLLKTLRDMNFALSVRLNLHEELPSHFCNYSINNGRATFVVPHEFELDLAVADEDAASPFYFIDIRFLFANAPPLADGFVRSSLEGKVNQVLELNGLSACYEFLHGFVLTHKITLLRRQAFELARSRWTECLRVEPIHRSLVVQYWTNQPGGKNWIEIGIAKGPDPEGRHNQPSNPVRLNIRWFRGGKEATDVRFTIDPANPSIEHILDQVTAAHMTLRLATVSSQVQKISPPNSALSMNLRTSATDPNACSLSMKLGPSGSDITLRVVPVTGNMSISPVTAISTDVEQRLNADPSADAARIVTYLHCKLLQDQITRQAIRAGWMLVLTDKQQDTKKVFGDDVVRRTTFTRRGWGENWAMTVSISLGGTKWWIVRLANTQTGRHSIQSAEILPVPSTSTTLDRKMLFAIESRAIAQVSFSNVVSQLRKARMHHDITHVMPVRIDTQASPSATAVIGIRFEDLMQPEDPKLRQAWKPWCLSSLVLSHHGLDESSYDNVKVIHILKAVVQPEIAADLANCINKGQSEDDICFLSDGVCALRLRTQFGTNLIPLIQARLRRVERLSYCLRALKRHDFRLLHAGVSRLTFVYQSSPPLSAEINYSDSTFSPMKLQLHAPGHMTNPHRCIQAALQKLLGGNTSNHVPSSLEEAKNFDELLSYLSTTLPVLRALDAIEAQDPSGRSNGISHRSVTFYRLIYSSPLPDLRLDISMRRKNGKDFWCVQPAKAWPVKDQHFLQALRDAWSQEVEGIESFRTGAIAGINAVEQLLLRLDAVVRSNQKSENVKKSKTEGHEIVVLD